MEIDIRFSYNSLLTSLRPDIIYLWGNNQFLHWAKDPKVGYTSIEFSPLWRTAYEIVTDSNENIRSSYPFKSAYAAYNPAAKLKSILGRERDPRYSIEHKPLTRDELIYATPYHSLLAIRKLERALPDLVVVNETRQEFRNPILRYCKIGEKDTASDLAWNIQEGNLAKTEDLLKTSRIKQARVQTFKSLKSTLGHYTSNNDIIDQIRMIKQSGQPIPFLIDISVRDLLKCDAIGRSDLYKGTKNLKMWHYQIIEFIKAV